MKECDFNEISKEDIFELIGKKWMLVTAGNKEKLNTMTVSWGGFGWLWNKPVATIYIRPGRYTREFIEQNEKLTLSVLPESCRKALQICGSKSGRSCDKIAEAGLTPIEIEEGVMGFKESEMTIVARKAFKSLMSEENFLNKENLERWYKPEQGGMHYIYIVEIEKVIK